MFPEETSSHSALRRNENEMTPFGKAENKRRFQLGPRDSAARCKDTDCTYCDILMANPPSAPDMQNNPD